MGNVTLEVKNVYKENKLKIFHLLLRKEIVGFTGLFGSGKTELRRIIFGLTKPDKGQIKVFGKKLKWQDVNYSKSLGLGFVTEDRKDEGIVPLLSVAE